MIMWSVASQLLIRFKINNSRYIDSWKNMESISTSRSESAFFRYHLCKHTSLLFQEVPARISHMNACAYVNNMHVIYFDHCIPFTVIL